MIHMRGFQVSLNGKKLCVASVGDQGVLTAIVSSVTGERATGLSLDVGGFAIPIREHVNWVKQKPLRIGDNIVVKIIETVVIDRPIQRQGIDKAEELRAQKRSVRMMAKNLGWKIQAPTKR